MPIALVLPAVGLIAVTAPGPLGLWRGRPMAIRLAYGLTSFLTLELAAVVAMGLTMLARNDPAASPALVFALAPIFVVLATLWVLLLHVDVAHRGATHHLLRVLERRTLVVHA